jgi:hypothetical protein
MLIGDITYDLVKGKVGENMAITARALAKKDKVITEARNRCNALGRDLVVMA